MGALRPDARRLLGEPVTKAAVYDLEQAIQVEVAENLMVEVINGALEVDSILSDHFVRDMHRRLYADIWTWAGAYRRRDMNLGVAPEQIATQMRDALDTARYRWSHTYDWTPRQLGIAVHAELVRVHPFVDGNGRTIRLLADLVFLAAQDGDVVEVYDWRLDKRSYVALLREYDQHRDASSLASFIATQPLNPS